MGESGSLAFRTTGACEGAECAEIETMTVAAFPCESTALTEGRRLADVDLTAQGCGDEPTLASEVTPEQAVMTVVNETADEMSLYFLDFEGERLYFGPVEAGESRIIWTYMRTPWVLANTQDECQGIYFPVEEHGIVTVQ